MFCTILFLSKVNGNSAWKAVPFKFYLPSFISNQQDTKNNYTVSSLQSPVF